jgi:hypothetical protein
MSHGKGQTSKSTGWRFVAAVMSLVVLLCLVGLGATSAQSTEGTEFPGTVLTVDQAAGKFAVKKDGGGTRFTFLADNKTTFSGAGLSSLKDLKKDDHVVVTYQVQGPKYLAIRVARK